MSSHMKPLRKIWMCETPRLDAEFAVTISGIPAGAVLPVIITVGGPISVWPSPNTLISFACEFCVDVHLHTRELYSPHLATWLRKNFCPPHSTLYVIGSLHAHSPSPALPMPMNGSRGPPPIPPGNENSWSRPNACAVSCAAVQQMLLTRSLGAWWFANENEITLSCALQSDASGAIPSTSLGWPMSCGWPAMTAIVYDTPPPGIVSVTVIANGE